MRASATLHLSGTVCSYIATILSYEIFYVIIYTFITVNQQSSKQEPNKTSNKAFTIQFSMLLANVGCLLDNKCNDKLEKCKQFCCTLKVSDESSKLLFDNMQLKEINQCGTFHQLFSSQLHLHLNWEEYFILESIIALTELKEAEDELDKYKKYMASKMGMRIISDTFSLDDLPQNSIKLLIIVDKPYTKLTVKEYVELKEFIFTTLKIERYITFPYIRFFFESLHLEWYIPVQAAGYLIKMATNLNESLFHEHLVVFVKAGNEVLFDCTIKQVRLCICVYCSTYVNQLFNSYSCIRIFVTLDFARNNDKNSDIYFCGRYPYCSLIMYHLCLYKYLSLGTVVLYLIVVIDKENYGFHNFHTSNNQLKTGFCQ